MKYLTAILLLTMNASIAETVPVFWQHPTERENEDPLDISEIAGTNVWFKIDGAEYGPFLYPVFTTSINAVTSPIQSCIQRSTLLHNGQESKKTEWFCFSNTPKGE